MGRTCPFLYYNYEILMVANVSASDLDLLAVQDNQRQIRGPNARIRLSAMTPLCKPHLGGWARI